MLIGQHPRLRKLTLFLLLLVSLSLVPTFMSSAAEPTIRIGVLAHRPKPETAARFLPLARYLQEALPNREVRLDVYTYTELEAELAAHRLDFVLTNPGHYVQLRHANGMSGVLATMIEDEGGTEIHSFGGVIFAMADRADIRSIADVKGKRIAVVGTGSLGGYQAQAYELAKTGIRLPADAKLLVTGMPHDSAVTAVIDGRADVGMVRTGVLEQMAAEKKVDLSRLKILNRENIPGFPAATSTPLYPQWPFVALPHADQDAARQVAAALLAMKHVVRSNGLHGFAVPADYAPVEELLRELRMPPFEQSPYFTLRDIWARYGKEMAALAVGGLIIAFLGVRLIVTNRKLQESELRYRTVADRLSDKVAELEASMAKVKQLEGVIPICMHCKNIRNDKESWQQLETYISAHTDAMFSHGICPSCMDKYYAT